MGYESEQNIIGSLLIDNKAIEQVPFLKPEMFTDDLFAEMFVEFCKGRDEKYPVDTVVLSDALQAHLRSPEEVNGRIFDCVDKTVTAANIRAHSRIVWNDYRSRQFKKIINSVTGDAQDIDNDIDETIAALETIRVVDTTRAKSLAQITKENKDRYFREDDRPRVNLGLKSLDDILGGLEGGDLIIVGARPAVGKSAFATQIAMNFAILGKRVGYFNLEMQEKQVYERFVCARSGIDLTRLRRAIAYQKDEQERFDEANAFLEKQRDIVVTTGSKRISDIRAESKSAGYDVIIIDYLQLVKSDRTYGANRYAEVGAISHAVKSLAMELNIPIIGLCQLNRASEGREDKEPTMGELRESGDFEQDASVILLLWNTDKEDRSRKCIKVEKQRQGRTGKVRLAFDGGHMKFTEENGAGEEFVDVPDDMELVFD